MRAIFRLTTALNMFFIFFTSSHSAFAISAQFGLSPDNNLGLLISSIQSAKKSLLINVYQFDHPEVVQAVVEKIKSGVQVKILIEGQPVGKISQAGSQALDQLKSAMDQRNSPKGELYLMQSSGRRSERRYTYDHAKYIVIDSKHVLISSENFTGSGHPFEGNTGNRGWSVFLKDTPLAQELAEIFQEDTELSFGDITDYQTELNTRLPLGDSELLFFNSLARPVSRTVPAIQMGAGEVRQATLVTSPNSLNGIQGMIQLAKKKVRLEFMSLPLRWRIENSDRELERILSERAYQLNPLVQSLITAAQEGVEVEVLINREDVFSHPHLMSELMIDDLMSTYQESTVDFLNTLAHCYSLPIQAKYIDTKKLGLTYIHNKGIISDDHSVMVSSINSTQTSVMKNREVAVILKSPAAAQYFKKAFDEDWSQSSFTESNLNECPEL